MKKYIICALFFAAVLLCVHQSAHTQTLLSENVIRLHVLANSDTAEDQKVKLLVRDAILCEFASGKFTSADASEKMLQQNLPQVINIANEVLAENGFTYIATARFGTFDFPARRYDNVYLPAGKYRGLQIRLGNACGQNWWCVMYPPLCLNTLNAKAEETNEEKVTFHFKYKLAEILDLF